MSMEEADAKFPNSRHGIPPSPTIENPGQVFPKSDPDKAAPLTPSYNDVQPSRYIGNPYLMRGAFQKLGQSLGEVIEILESEERSVGNLHEENPLLQKFRDWREDLDRIRGGMHTPGVRNTPRLSRCPSPEREGGMFTD